MAKAQSQAKKRNAKARKRAAHVAVRNGTKAGALLKLLLGPEGATLGAMMKATGWQQHSVRGFLAGHVRKKLKLQLLSDKGSDGIRRYRISEDSDARS